MQYWWNDVDKAKPKYLEKNHWYCMCSTTHRYCSGIETKPLLWEAAWIMVHPRSILENHCIHTLLH